MKNVKRLLNIVYFTLASMTICAQNGINYQGVLRNNQGGLMANAEIDLRFRILPQEDPSGPAVFAEEHKDIITNNQGVFHAIIGNEDISAFRRVDFSRPYEMEVSVRLPKEFNFQILHRSPMSAAPYAMHAFSADNVDDADADPENEIQTLTFDASKNILSISGGNQIQLSGNGSDGDSDPNNELQQLTRQGNRIRLSRGGGDVIDMVEDADADPGNELQSLKFNPSSNTLSISGGNSISLPLETNSDDDDDPTNELQRISLLSNGKLQLSKNGGEIQLNQSPLIPTKDTEGKFAYKLLQPLAIAKDRPTAGITLDVAGPVKASLYRLFDVKMLPNGNGFDGLRLENDKEILAKFVASSGSRRPTLEVDEIKIGKGKVRLFSQTGFDGEFWVEKVGLSEKLMRIGEKTSAINTQDLFVSDHLHIYHPSKGNGQTGLQIYNLGGKGNFWNLYTSNSNGNLEFWFKGAIKSRISSSNGSLITNSDRRLKTHIESISTVLPSLLKLQAKKYQFKNDAEAKPTIGFITQDVAQYFPDLVYTEEETSFQGLNYQDFAVLSVKAIQELHEIVEEQHTEIEEMKAELEDLRMLVTDLIKK